MIILSLNVRGLEARPKPSASAPSSDLLTLISSFCKKRCVVTYPLCLPSLNYSPPRSFVLLVLMGSLEASSLLGIRQRPNVRLSIPVRAFFYKHLSEDCLTLSTFLMSMALIGTVNCSGTKPSVVAFSIYPHLRLGGTPTSPFVLLKFGEPRPH